MELPSMARVAAAVTDHKAKGIALAMLLLWILDKALNEELWEETWLRINLQKYPNLNK